VLCCGSSAEDVGATCDGAIGIMLLVRLMLSFCIMTLDCKKNKLHSQIKYLCKLLIVVRNNLPYPYQDLCYSVV
jgi:hypothetical protein